MVEYVQVSEGGTINEIPHVSHSSELMNFMFIFSLAGKSESVH